MTMLARLWSFLNRQIVTEVPAELSACLDCGRVQCDTGTFDVCPTRLARQAALQAQADAEARQRV